MGSAMGSSFEDLRKIQLSWTLWVSGHDGKAIKAE